MPRQPSPRLERIAGWLIPIAVGEEVLGDLYESYRSPARYLIAVARLAPLVLFSRIRRTADPQVACIVTLLVYLCYFTAGWLRSEAASLAGPAFPAAATLAGMLIADAFAWRPHPVRGPMAGSLLALMAGGVVAYWFPDLALPSGTVALGAGPAFVLASATRMLLPPDASRFQPADGRSALDPAALPFAVSHVRLALALAAILAWAILKRS